MKFTFKGKTIDISEGKQTYWSMKHDYNNYLNDAISNFKKNYNATGNLRNLIDKYGDLVDCVDQEAFMTMYSLMATYARIELNVDGYADYFKEKLFDLFEVYEEELYRKYNQVVDKQEEKLDYRKRRKANRTRWYGITTEGKTTAGMKNAGNWALHSTRNLIGNTASAVGASLQMKSIFNDKKRIESMCLDIKSIYAEIWDVLLKIMENQNDTPFEIITNQNDNDAKQLIETAKTKAVGTNEHIEAALGALEHNPALKEIYQYLIESYGDINGEISSLAERFFINLEEWKVEKLKERLKKNAATDISDESKILNEINVIEKECEFWWIPSEEYTKSLKSKWEELDQYLRTVEGKLFETRVEADSVKEDIKLLNAYSYKNDLLEADVDKVANDIINSLKSDLYKECIIEKLYELKEQQDIKNIQRSTMRIISYMPMYSKITKCFDYGHIFSHKVGYEKLQEALADGQKVAFVYDPALMNKGNHGILLTNKNLYVYSNNEIKAFDLSDYECTKVREGKIYILHGGEEIDTGLNVNLDQILYNFFSETIDRVVLMCRTIKNSEAELNDEDVYDNIIIRSKQAEFVRHNKKIVAIAVGIVIFILAIVFVNITSGKNKNTDVPIQETEEVYDEVEEIEGENITGSNDVDASSSVDNYVSENSDSNWIVPENTSYAWDINYGDIIISFLNDETMGWYINDDSVEYFSDLLMNLEDGNTIQITGYTIVDMDSDLQPEVVLMLEGMLDGYYLVLHYNNQDEELPIYAVLFGYRGMSQLQQNGVYAGSSGADTYGYYVSDFDLDRTFQEIEMAKVENGQYFVQSKAVTKDEFDGYYQNVLADYMVEWRDYSLATLAEEVRASWIPEEEVYENSEFILEGSDQYYLDWYELEGLTAEECKIARNEIYARHGRMFNDAELQEYFNSCSWYVGYISADDFNEDMLSDIEKSNRDLIIEYEAEMGYR